MTMTDTPTIAPHFNSLREKIAFEKQERLARYAKFREVFGRASAAGYNVGARNKPTPMTVVEDVGPHRGRTYYASEGMCGFAWVRIRPATSSFAKWLVKNGHGRTSHSGGVDIWISDHGQSIERKEAHARAMAEVLRNELGIEAWAGSRLD